MIYTALLISLASLGFRAITGKGMILYFLRKPFDKISDKLSAFNKKNKELIDIESQIEYKEKETFQMNGIAKLKYDLSVIRVELSRLETKINFNIHPPLLYIMKPILLCSTCMASIHTLIWYPFIEHKFDFNMIFIMLIVASLNTLIWSFIEMIQRIK